MINRVAIVSVRSVSLFFRALSWRACRFHPSCSEYACAAFARFSFARALRLSLGRLLRCRPFSPGGFDPLPEGSL